MRGPGKLCQAGLLLAALVAATPVHAQSPAGLPAVDGINGKFAGFGGTREGQPAGIADINLTIPVGHRYGAQFDIGIGTVDGNFVHATGAHFFWRTPARGLAGFEIVHGRNAGNGFDLLRIGLEGELYLDNITLQIRGGFQALDIEHGGYVKAFFNWYPVPDLRLRAGGQLAHGSRSNRLVGSIEYQFTRFGSTGVSGFLDGSVGQNGFTAVFAGLRFHFGHRYKTLIRRHREDDPEGLVVPTVKDIQNSGLSTPVAQPPPLVIVDQ